MLGPWKGPAVNAVQPNYTHNGLALNDLHQTSPSTSPVLGGLQPAPTYQRKQSIVSSLAEQIMLGQ